MQTPESRSEVDAMVESLRAALDAAEWWAREASRKKGGDVPPAGVRWRWECPDHDVELVPNPAVDETLTCPVSEDCFSASLRSVEQFPTAGAGLLPQFAVYSTDEQSAVVAGHIIRNAPAVALALVAAHREMLDELLSMPHQSGHQWRMEYLCPKSMPAERWEAMVGDPWVCDCGRDAFVERMVRRLAAAYADRDESGRPA